MTSPELDRLAEGGHLEREPPVAAQVAALIAAGEEQLRDAEGSGLSLRGRFQLAYGAAYALASAALRRAGFRAENRYLAFQSARAHALDRRADLAGAGSSPPVAKPEGVRRGGPP